MNHLEKRIYLIETLLEEQAQYKYRNTNFKFAIPNDEIEQKHLLRLLFNIREPLTISDEFLQVQDEYLQEELQQKKIVNIKELQPEIDGIYLWQGDITTLQCDAIVNAANSQLLGCFYPCHRCIDNAIHTFAGIQLRLACAKLMEKQQHEEKAGNAKITPAFNLPCKYVLHTVGPIIYDEVTAKDKEVLASCYRSCLNLAEKNNLKSIAFCCISTGEFHFPNELAAKIAIHTVKEYKAQKQSKLEVIFNVFKDADYEIYKKLLK